jgi:hypothetical protein
VPFAFSDQRFKLPQQPHPVFKRADAVPAFVSENPNSFRQSDHLLNNKAGLLFARPILITILVFR